MTSLCEKDTADVLRSSISEHRASEMASPISSTPLPEGVKERYENIKKSQNDTRLYRGLLLSNDMKVLLISDSTTDRSAACLDVDVGMMSDPSELPGLAHFCEHMLFLGTEKYPNRDDYNSFLSQHGGSANAMTLADYTNYYFDVTPENLDGALDRFSQFFVKPLFTESATGLEVNAVNSEHEKNVANDTWRTDQLQKSSADPSHPYSKFGTGNIQTLDILPKEKGIDVREALLKFYDTWYSANIMALSVLGKESLDELEKMVVDRFVQVRNLNVEPPSWPEHPFTEEHFQCKWYVVPVKDIRYLNLIFPLPDLQEHWKSFPVHYIGHLLGHEGDGSVLSALKKAGWGDSLMAGDRPQIRGGANFFTVLIDLTEEGLNHVDDIITLIFQYINMLKKAGPVEWIYDEYSQIAKMDFEYKEKVSPQSYVYATVRALQKYPMEEILTAPCLFTEWRPDLTTLVTEQLSTENVRVYVIGKAFEEIATEVEPWYGTKFCKEKIPTDVLDKWRNCGLNEDLAFPMKNEFIPQDFVIRANQRSEAEKMATEKYPTIIEDTPLMRVWFKQDDEFLLPKISLTFDLASSVAHLDPINCNLTYIYVKLVKDSLNEYVYNASLAGLSWEFSCSKYGITIAIGGYNDKHRILLEKILNKMVNLTIDPKRFEIIKETHIRGLKNAETEQPYKTAVYYLAALMSELLWKRDDLLAVVDLITIERLQSFIPQMLTKVHIESLIHGNLNKAEALETARLVESKLKEAALKHNERQMVPLFPRQLLLQREVNLDSGCNFLYQVETSYHKSSCAEVYYQCGMQSTESNMHLELLAQIISVPCFNTLRTQEQLGYIVFSAIRRVNGVQGIRVIVQSERHPSYVDNRIELFVETMLEYLENMSDEEFNRHKASLAMQRLEKPKMLCSLASIFWSEIGAQQYHFDRANVEVAYLMTLTKEQILQYFKEVMYKESPTRRKVAVHVISMNEGGAGVVETTKDEVEEQLTEAPVEIKDILVFKTSQSLYPLLKPYNGLPLKGQRSKL